MSSAHPPRVIDLPAGLAVVVGSMLGIGIFLAPPQMAGAVTDPLAFFATWVAVAVVIVGGALAYAELGTRMPRAGGDYTFQRRALGASVAFGSGWALFGGIFAGSIATVALAVCQYQIPTLTGLPLGEPLVTAPLIGPITGAQLMAIGLVIALTALNVGGLRLSARTQQVVTGVPLVLLFGLAVYAIAVGGPAPVPATAAPLTAGALATAWLAANFAFSGWNQVIYIAGEVEDPDRVIPRSLLGGTAIVTVLYLLLCAAFVAVLGMGGLATAGEAGSALARALGGESLYLAINALIALCLIATVNGSILGGARVGYAMARDGVFLRAAGELDRRGSPATALWIQAAIAVALLLTNTVDGLLQAVSLTMVITGALTVAAYFVIRHRDPDGPGWRAPGHPWLPGLYIAVNLWVLAVEIGKAFDAVDAGREGASAPLIGLAIVVLAALGHAVTRGRRSAA